MVLYRRWLDQHRFTYVDWYGSKTKPESGCKIQNSCDVKTGIMLRNNWTSEESSGTNKNKLKMTMTTTPSSKKELVYNTQVVLDLVEP
jgi:hypothetical protein